ncbi:MAG: TonB-dependent receptor [Rhodospirillaceae bacterium]
MRKFGPVVGAAAAALALAGGTAHGAERSKEDVLTSAEDAFGTTVGGETIGLYSAMSARGFSPVQAGNLRLEGLYFDTRSAGGSRIRISDRLTGQVSVHVGLSAQSYPFPGPTGIANYILRVPGDEAALSAVVRGGLPESEAIELDGQVPLSDSFALSLGASAKHTTENGRTSTTLDGAAIGRWNFAEGAQAIAFYSRTRELGKKSRPFLFGANAALPVKFDRSKDLTADWAMNNNDDASFGAIVKASWEDWRFGIGVFRSLAGKPDGESAQVHYRNIQPDGDSELWVVKVAGDEKYNASVSGEARLSRLFVEAERRHTVHLNVRGKSTQNAFGGNVARRIGTTKYYDPPPLAAPTWTAGPRGREHAALKNAGLAYEVLWKGVGEFSAGVQRAAYTREAKLLNPTPAETTRAWLYNSTLAAYLGARTVLYGSYTRGLEDAPRAPPFSVSAGASASAATTKQIDAGVRFAAMPGVNLVAGVFEVTKPFFELDTSGIFGRLGTVRHRGVEVSLSGNLAPGLTVVAGLVGLQARLSGPLVDNGTMGRVPPEAVPVTGIFNVQYGPAAWNGFSVDARLNHKAPTMANVENTFKSEAVTTLNIGARYRFRLGDKPATLRLQAQNALDAWAWEVQGTQRQLMPTNQREVTLQLTVDY